ncbi:MAG: tyrosine-type recombinase/integrase [Polyangia bacterium]
MPRARRRGGFGYIVSKGTPTHPLFAIRWREGSRHKQKSGFKTRTEAAEALARVRVGLGDGTLVEKRRASIGFDQIAKEWLKLHSAPNLRSHADNEERFRLHVEPFFKDAPLSAVTPTRILELRTKLQTSTFTRRRRGADGKVHEIEVKLAPRTVNLVMALVRSILRFAVANGHIPTSPTDRVGRGKLMVPLERPKLAPPIPDVASAGQLLAELRRIGEGTNRPSLFPMFATLLYTGIRRGEAPALRWADVDLDRRILTVRRSYEGMTKSKKHRPVPIPAELVAILREYRLADPWKGELVFPNDQGEMYSPNAKLEDVLRAALTAAGLPRIRVHDLRHAFASFFVMAGGDIFTLQRILGHSTPQLVSDTYGHLSPTHLVNQSDRISFPSPKEEKDAEVFALNAGA